MSIFNCKGCMRPACFHMETVRIPLNPKCLRIGIVETLKGFELHLFIKERPLSRKWALVSIFPSLYHAEKGKYQYLVENRGAIL